MVVLRRDLRFVNTFARLHVNESLLSRGFREVEPVLREDSELQDISVANNASFSDVIDSIVIQRGTR